MKKEKLINKTNTMAGKFYGLIDTFACGGSQRVTMIVSQTCLK